MCDDQERRSTKVNKIDTFMLVDLATFYVSKFSNRIEKECSLQVFAETARIPYVQAYIWTSPSPFKKYFMINLLCFRWFTLLNFVVISMCMHKLSTICCLYYIHKNNNFATGVMYVVPFDLFLQDHFSPTWQVYQILPPLKLSFCPKYRKQHRSIISSSKWLTLCNKNLPLPQ